MPYNSINNVPSIWDYLSQGVQQGYDVYRDVRNNRQEQEARKQAAALQSINMALEQNRQGNLPYTQVNQMIQQSGNALPEQLRNFRLNAPSPLELRSNIANTPDMNMAVPLNPMGGTPGAAAPMQVPGALKYTDAQLTQAGLPDRGAREMSALQAQNARLGIISNQLGIKQQQHNTSDMAFQLDDMKKKQEMIQQLASNSVDQVIAANGGLFRAMHGNLGKMVDQGFANLKKSGALSVFGSIDPGTEQYLKNEMHSKLIDQQLAAYQAETGRISALNRGFGQQNAQLSFVDKMMDNIQQRINSITAEENALKASDRGTFLMLPDSSTKNMPGIAEMKQKLRDYQQQRMNLKLLQMKVATGQVTNKDFMELGIDAEGQPLAPGQAAVPGQQGASAGQAPVRSPAGASGGRAGAQVMTPDDLTRAAAFLKTMPRNTAMEYIRARLAAGQITPEDAAKLGYKP